MARAKRVEGVKPHVKKGDIVLVMTGKSAGKRGKVLQVFPKTGRIVVEGVNFVKRHTKPTRALPQGGILQKEGAIDSSNVMLFCSKCSNPTRVGKTVLEDGKTARVCKKCGEAFDQ
jgi:large subunit ribosomal protein L24